MSFIFAMDAVLSALTKTVINLSRVLMINCGAVAQPQAALPKAALPRWTSPFAVNQLVGLVVNRPLSFRFPAVGS